MQSNITGMIHVLEFECQAPLKFYEHCKKCPRFGNDCPDLSLGVELLRRKRKLIIVVNSYQKNMWMLRLLIARLLLIILKRHERNAVIRAVVVRKGFYLPC